MYKHDYAYLFYKHKLIEKKDTTFFTTYNGKLMSALKKNTKRIIMSCWRKGMNKSGYKTSERERKGIGIISVRERDR